MTHGSSLGNPPNNEWGLEVEFSRNEERGDSDEEEQITEAHIMGIMRQVEGGLALADVCREHAISSATFYKWRSKYSGMDASMIADMKVMEDENRRLKKMFAELSMQNELLKEALGKK